MMTFDALDRAVAKLTAPLKRRVQLMVGRAVIVAVNDATKVQSLTVELSEDETADEVERFQQYGFTSVPFSTAEAIMVAVAGYRAHMVAVATDDRTLRPTGLAEGDVALYNEHGTAVLLENDTGDVLFNDKDNGLRIHLDSSENEVLLGDTPSNYVALANLCKSEIESVQGAFNTFITAFNAHTHDKGTYEYTAGNALFGGNSGQPLPQGISASAVGDVAADEVKAK